MKYGDLIEKLSLEEKASLCVGNDYWHSVEFEQYGIPNITMSDGPHGLRVQKTKADNLGINESEISTCFPASASLGNTWNRELVYLLGKTLGEEARKEEVNVVLGPAINIKRSPLCGRNFEYFSEDPYLTGILSTEYVKGLQSTGVGACVKHFAVNNQENRRRTIDAIVDERALREVYLKAFELIVKNAKPWSVMSAYNKVNGEYCSENQHLLKDILRDEWNFDGIVISDWGAENDRVKGLLASHELEMPGGRGNGADEIVLAVKCGKVPESVLDEAVDRIIDVAIKGQQNLKKCIGLKDQVEDLERKTSLKSEAVDTARKIGFEYDQREHHEIARKIAEETIVLLKNEDGILPVKEKKIAVIGDMAKIPRYQGAGSSTINPYKIENAYDNFVENGIEVEYAKGYERIEFENDESLRREAVKLAEKNDIVIVFAGLTENYESEGVDRVCLDMPANQNKLIEEVCKVNKNVIIVLANGSPVLMPWKDSVKAIVAGYIGGEAGGKAIVDCILGKVNPSGKLAESYPVCLEDTSCFKNYPGNELTVEYKESVFIGYKFYDKVGKNVLFPFGFGLSYTDFEYSDLEVCNENEKIVVRFKIKNVGSVVGKEIAQIYIKKADSVVFRPEKELRDFVKVELAPGEVKEACVCLDKNCFEYFDIENDRWQVEAGEYEILIGKSSRDIVLSDSVVIDSEDVCSRMEIPEKYWTGNVQDVSDEDFEKLFGRKLPDKVLKIENITAENTLEQIKNTAVGKVIYDYQIEKMNRLFLEQNVNKATKVMMDLQKPLKKFYEKKSSKITKEMVDELIDIAKKNKNFKECAFVKEYLK